MLQAVEVLLTFFGFMPTVFVLCLRQLSLTGRMEDMILWLFALSMYNESLTGNGS